MSVVGIDLGTTNSVVACVRDGRVQVLADEQGNRLLPSVVNFHPNGDVLVGHAARARRLVDAKNTIASIKRLIGRPWDSDEIRLARARFAFELREGPGQGALVVARGEAYTLPEISAFVLKRVKQIAETALGETVDKAIITVPAHFNELQRTSTKVAGRVAGLEVLRIMNEPTAAALAYGLGSEKSERVVVYDFGGGTFDCSLLDLTGTLFEVLATAGDTFLGGDDIDTAIAESMCAAFLAQHRYDPRVDPQAFEKLRSAAEDLKKDLSVNMQAQVDLPEVAYGVAGRRLGLNFGMTQADLDALAGPYVERTLQVTQDALGVARLSPSSFDQIVLVGGSTRMPMVKRRVEAFFGIPVIDRVNPDEVVAIGAAVQAAALVDASRKRSIPAPPRPGVIGPPLKAEPAPGGLPPDEANIPTEVLAVPNRRIKSLPPIQPTAPSRASSPPGEPKKPTLRPALPPVGPPPPAPPAPATSPFTILTPFGTLNPQSLADTLDGSLQATSQNPVLPEDRSFASSNTLPAQEPVGFPDAKNRGNTLSMAKGAAARRDEAPESAPHTLPLPTLPLGAGFADPSRHTASPKIIAPPTPWPGWRPVGPLATEDISRIVPDALNRSIVTQAPVIGPLPTEDISRIVPDAYNRSVSVKSPLAPPGPPRRVSDSGLPPILGGFGGATEPSRAEDPLAATRNDPRRAEPPMPPPRPRAPTLVDVTPRALVVETVGGFCDVVIPRNARIPCEHTRAFTTGRDEQTVVHVRVAQGEKSQFQENTYLGELELSGLRSAPRGEVTLAVLFELDANGSLQVRAMDKVSGREARAAMKLVAVAQSEEEIEEMIERSASISVTG